MPQVPNTNVIDLTQSCTPVEGGKLVVESNLSWVWFQSDTITGEPVIRISRIDQNKTQGTRFGSFVVKQFDGNENLLKTLTIKIMQDGMSYTYEYEVTSITLVDTPPIEPYKDNVTLKWELVKKQKFDNGTYGTITTTTEYGGAEVGTNSDSAHTRTITGISADTGSYVVIYPGSVTQNKNYKTDGDEKYEIVTTNNPYPPSAQTVSYDLVKVIPFYWAVENADYPIESRTVIDNSGSYNVKAEYDLDADWDTFVETRFKQYEDTDYVYTVELDGDMISPTYTISSYVRHCKVTFIVKNPVANTKIKIVPYVSGGTSTSAITTSTASYGPVEFTLTGNKNYDSDGDNVLDSFSGITEFDVRWYDLYRTTGTPNANSIIGAIMVYKNGNLVENMTSGEDITVIIE